MTNQPQHRILIIDSDVQSRTALSTALLDAGVDSDIASGADEAVSLLERREYWIILWDVHDGLARMSPQVATMSKTSQSIVILTSALDTESVRRVAPASAHAIVRKPYEPARIAGLIGELVRSAPKLSRQRLAIAPYELL